MYGYSTPQVLDGAEPIQVTFGTEERKRKTCTLHRSRRSFLDDLELTDTTKCHARSRGNMELDYFLNLTFFSFGIPGRKYTSEIRQKMSVRRPCFRCFAKYGGYTTAKEYEGQNYGK